MSNGENVTFAGTKNDIDKQQFKEAIILLKDNNIEFIDDSKEGTPNTDTTLLIKMIPIHHVRVDLFQVVQLQGKYQAKLKQ